MLDLIANALTPLQGYCDAWCLQFWNVVGAWIAGLSTAAAVIVSLYLARADSRIRLEVHARIGLVVGDPSVSHLTEHLWISVYNVGRRTATLNSVGWRLGIFPQWMPWLPRRYALQNADFPGSTRCPVKLEDGGTATFMIPLDDWAGHFAANIVDPPYWLSVRFIKIQAHASTGATFSRRIAVPLRDQIHKRASKARAMRRA